MYVRALCAAAGLVFFGAAAASASNLVVDGDFEGGISAFNADWDPHSQIANNVGVSMGFAPSTFPQAGSWFAFFGDGIPIENFIDQSFSTTIGHTYTLSFWVAIEPDNVADGNTQDTHNFAPQVDVGWTGSGFNLLTYPASDTNTMPYTEYTYNYIASASTTSLEFSAVDSYETAVLLDTISVTDDGVVPEPATFALAGAGLVAVGCLRRRKQR
jgi:hypothetical protein